MKSPYDILRSPVITEKASILRSEFGHYVFEVDPCANKIEIRQAIEQVFPGVKVERVNTARVRGKIKRHGRTSGRRPLRKKAFVLLKKDSKPIEVFDA